ncbi:MAG: DNA-directed RNA polymerase subunit A' [Candidatus Korarchaeota archaeon]
MIPKRLSQIMFGILSPDEIISMSVASINTAELYSIDGKPMRGGPLDPRLGPATNESCETCGLKRRDGLFGCVGHFGYIDLATPIYHLAFVKWIQLVLNGICERCGRLTLPSDVRERFWKRMKKFFDLYGYPRIELAKKILTKAAELKACPYCGHQKNFTFKFDKQIMTFVKMTEVTEDEAKTLEPKGVKITKKMKGGKIHYYCERRYEPDEIRRILASIYSQYEHLNTPDAEERRKDLILMGFHPSRSRPEWAILTVLPVPPITIRPPAIPSSGERQEDKLTLILRDIIRENNRIKDKLEGGPRKILEQYLIRIHHLVATLFGLRKYTKILKEPKGIFHRLHGKEGLFRKYLSGKRVDFSARAVISPDTYISIDEVGIPQKVAMRFLVAEVVNRYNINRLRELVKRGPWRYPGAVYIYKRETDGTYTKISLENISPEMIERHANDLAPGDIVERHLVDGDIVVFNRQPTLHRISMMGHYVRVLPYNTFRIHVQTCTPYNADFDGDEMNLHLARSYETQAEVSTLMEVKKHIISPRYGGPIIGPKHDYITSAFLMTKPDTYLEKSDVFQLLYAAGITEPIPLSKVENGKELWAGKDIFSAIIPPGIFYKGKIKGRVLGVEKDLLIEIRDGKIVQGFIDKNSIGAEKPENLIQKIVERYNFEEAKKFLNNLSALLLRYITDRGFSITLWDINVPESARKEIKTLLDKYMKEANDLVNKYLEGKLEPEPGLSQRETLEEKIIRLFEDARGKAGEIITKHMPSDSQFMIMTLTGARGGDVNIQQVLATLGPMLVRGKRLQRGYSNRTLSSFKKGEIGPLSGGIVLRSFVEGLDPIGFFFHNAAGRDSLVDTAIRTADSGYFYRRLVNALQDIRIEYDLSARTIDGKIIQFKYGGDGIHVVKSYHGKLTDVEALLDEIILKREKDKREIEVYSREWPSYYNSLIENVHKRISKATAKDLEDALKNFLDKGIVFSEDEVEYIFKRLLDRYIKAIADPGEPIGIVTSQSLSEPATQLTLRTFHWAGAVAITRGLPRIKEIFDAVRVIKRPIIRAYLEADFREDEKKAYSVLARIKGISLEDVATDIILDAEGRKIIISLDPEKLSKHDVSIDDIDKKLRVNKKIEVTTDKEKKQIVIELPSGKALRGREPSLGELYMKLRLSLIIKGIADYTDAKLTKKSGSKEYYLVIASQNLSNILCQDGIDLSRLECNNIREFAKIYGIEAARLLAIKETLDVLDYYGLDVDVRHISMAVDAQFWPGKPTPIGRYGLVRAKQSVLARASFEEVKKHIIAAAIAGEIDPVIGVAESVITGQTLPVGTGVVRVFYGFGGKSDKTEEESH